ncbi:hypothetical protein SOASR030_00170 [Leminorella grimontii]|uniref:XRE family transcriptional regulator n=1 Tax=Leminorella grimontii TaxID=82981 RepID=A0AAV5MW69_9GAMM|nr:hypothetical protein SOASR030_00170 [Leminorella grimontii]
MIINFVEELKNAQLRLNLTQVKMCEVLYGVPLRTYQSWLLGEKLPPIYYQHLILYRLSNCF